MARRPKPWYRKSRRQWHVTINGITHNLGANKKKAYEKFYALMKEPQVQQSKVGTDLASIIDAFLDWTEKHRAHDTYEWYRFRLQRFVDHYPNLSTSELKPFHVQQWADSYQLSQTSVRNYLRSLKRCIRWANQMGHLDENPIAHLELPPPGHKNLVISHDEFARFQSLIRDQAFADLVLVTWETGCRPQESLRVEARHVDLHNQRWIFPQSESKTKRHPRIVYLTDAAFHITKKLMLRQPAGPLFRNSQGLPWTTAAVNCAFDRLQVRMFKNKVEVSDAEINKFIPELKTTTTVKGAPRLKTPADLRCEAKRKLAERKVRKQFSRYSLYALRHSWATHALEKGLDGLTVAILMGHCDPSTLARVYQHLSHNPRHLLEQAKKAAG